MANETKNETARPSLDAVTYPADPSRAPHWKLPLRLAGGRLIVDALGRVVAIGESGRTLTESGSVRDWIAGRGDFGACAADDNAHALVHALNLAASDPVRESLRDLVRVIRECYKSDDPHGALDRIAEHADGAEQIMGGNVHNATPAGRVPGAAGQWIPAERCAQLAPQLHALQDSARMMADALRAMRDACQIGQPADLEWQAAAHKKAAAALAAYSGESAALRVLADDLEQAAAEA